MAIRCITKDLTICDYHEQRPRSRKVDLIGVTTSFWAVDGFPHTVREFCVYAELVNGVGNQTFRIKLFEKGSEDPLREYAPQEVYFPDQFVIKPFAAYISGLTLFAPGVYLIKLFNGVDEIGETEFLAGEGG